ALTVGTVQGVIQVQPANADWLYTAGHAGEWIDPISHAHINLVTGLTMLVAGALFALLPGFGGMAPSARLANITFGLLLTGPLAARAPRISLRLVSCGVGAYYAAGVAFSLFEAHRIANGRTFVSAVRAVEPWQALVLIPAALAVLVGFGAFARAAWTMTSRQ